MAGGTFTSQNKVRPGNYINFKSVTKPLSSIGTRGIVTFPVAMSWGPEGSVIELLSTDLVTDKSLAKIGLSLFDEGCQIYREALKNCYKALVYRIDRGGVLATATVLVSLVATAKYAGTKGNDISFSIADNGNGTFTVTTFVSGSEKHKQTVETAAEIVDNDWINFSGTPALAAVAGTTLVGGTNGTIENATYASYLTAIKAQKWDTMALPVDNDTVAATIVTFVKDLRDNFGKKVKAVLYDYSSADYEGIISVTQGYKTLTETVAATTFVVYIAALDAGSDIAQSNTYHVIEGATEIIGALSDDGILAALSAGELVLSSRQDGAIVIEQDINTLHTFTETKGYAFTKNRVMRTLDEINNMLKLKYEVGYLGKVDNDDNGRKLFKGDCINDLENLVKRKAIKNFDSTTDIEISAGEAIDASVLELAIQPNDSMEKLYTTVLVG